MGINPDMRNTIWPNGSIPHLLCHTRPTVGIGSRIYPALDVFCNKGTVGASTQFDTQRCRVTIECEPLLVSIQHDFDRELCLMRKAGDNRLVAHKRLRAERSTH